MRQYILLTLIGMCTVFGFTSCHDDDHGDVYPIIEWKIDLSTKLQNPAVPGRSETGTLSMALNNDNSLNYTFLVNNLSPNDVLTMAHFHTGDPLTNGPVILDFNPVFSGNTAYGTIMLRPSLADSLKASSNEIYFNVHSQQAPSGLVRGQVNSDILVASDIVLSGTNEVPPVQTSTTGMAYLRLSTNKKLYSKVVVDNVESGDALTMSHIHRGAVGTNGGVLINLCETPADFGVNKVTTLSGDLIKTLLTDSTYVNVHSTMHGSGIIRGQVKNDTPFKPKPNSY